MKLANLAFAAALLLDDRQRALVLARFRSMLERQPPGPGGGEGRPGRGNDGGGRPEGGGRGGRGAPGGVSGGTAGAGGNIGIGMGRGF